MRTVSKLLPMVLVLSAVPRARAERRNPLEGKPAVLHKVELRKLRFEISPQFVVSTNQDYKMAFGPGVNIQFHITDWVGVGAQFVYAFNANTPLENKVRAAMPNDPTGAAYTRPNTTLQMHDERVLKTNFLGSIYASITPWYGKFAMFSALFANYDFFVNGGVGFVNYTQDGCCAHKAPPPMAGDLPDPNSQDATQFAGFKVGGMIGVGVHIYFNDWLGVQLELRDYITKANPGGQDVNADLKLNGDDEGPQNSIYFGAGFTLMLPPKAKISH